MAIKNFWSLNVDEAIIADKIGKEMGEEYQVFFPVNSQLKDIDLIIHNLKTGKSKSIQVKGSRTYDTKRTVVKEMGSAKTSWNVISGSSIFEPTNKIDFFIFVMHQEEYLKDKRKMIQNYVIIPITDFRKITKNQKDSRKNGAFYHYSFAIKDQQLFECNNKKGKVIDFSKYLNNFDLLKF